MREAPVISAITEPRARRPAPFLPPYKAPGRGSVCDSEEGTKLGSGRSELYLQLNSKSLLHSEFQFPHLWSGEDYLCLPFSMRLSWGSNEIRKGRGMGWWWRWGRLCPCPEVGPLLSPAARRSCQHRLACLPGGLGCPKWPSFSLLGLSAFYNLSVSSLWHLSSWQLLLSAQ